jgi:translation elongation factor EF-Tu-like GTPase
MSFDQMVQITGDYCNHHKLLEKRTDLRNRWVFFDYIASVKDEDDREFVDHQELEVCKSYDVPGVSATVQHGIASAYVGNSAELDYLIRVLRSASIDYGIIPAKQDVLLSLTLTASQSTTPPALPVASLTPSLTSTGVK